MNIRRLNLIPALALAAVLLLFWGVPAAALSLEEYFSITYTTSFSKTEVRDSEPFIVTVTGSAVCTEDLPFPYDVVSEVRISGRIVARNTSSGTIIELYPRYTLEISPAPVRAGQTAEDSQAVSLQFPSGSPPGIYDITSELIEGYARAVVWLNITSHLPSGKSLGPVTLTVPDGSKATLPAFSPPAQSEAAGNNPIFSPQDDRSENETTGSVTVTGTGSSSISLSSPWMYAIVPVAIISAVLATVMLWPIIFRKRKP